MVRDGTEIPKVVEKCAQAIETFGEESNAALPAIENDC